MGNNIVATFSINAAGTAWGAISGDLSNQTDLQDALDAKANVDEVTTDVETINTAINAINTRIDGVVNSFDEDIETVNTRIDSIDNTISDIETDFSSLQTALTQETSNRENSDINLQAQIDAITASSDVTDIVGTYAQLQAYDTSNLLNGNIIKVLQDENQNDETTYYRWVVTNNVGNWTLIGEEGPYYTKSEADTLFVPQTRTVNNKPLGSNITLNAEDVGALPANTTIGSGILTIQKNGALVGSFSANSITNFTANIIVPTDVSELNNTSLATIGLTNLSALGLDTINQSKALETGNVSTNADVLAQIKQMAHSTFDLSKFIVTGSPTITSDGIASGFSSSNSIQQNIALTDDFIIEGEFTLEDNFSVVQELVFQISKNNLAYFDIRRYNTNINFLYRSTSNTYGVLFEAAGLAHIGESYTYKIIKSGSDIQVYINGVLRGTAQDVISTNDNYLLTIGDRGNLDFPFEGTIDLKKFSIIANGLEVISGNQTGVDSYTINGESVDIPYTLSKSGAKIVDAAYRSRVTALYEQEGVALYYTLDNDNNNFTLPMGDIYGMISRILTN